MRNLLLLSVLVVLSRPVQANEPPERWAFFSVRGAEIGYTYRGKYLSCPIDVLPSSTEPRCKFYTP
jgi:hypothetical protein